MSLLARVRDARASRRVSPIARQIRARNLTYLNWTKLAALEGCLREIDRTGTPGDVLEMGVALGGSAIVLAAGMGPGRAFHGYDVFGTIPPPSVRDDDRSHERYRTIAAGKAHGIRGDEYYGYADNLLGRVKQSFESFGIPVDDDRVSLHQGVFADTLHPPGSVALAHVDSDWYEPVRLCIERIHPYLSPGGFIVLDDFFDYAGCAKAAHEYLAAHDDLRLVRAPANAVVQRRPDF